MCPNFYGVLWYFDVISSYSLIIPTSFDNPHGFFLSWAPRSFAAEATGSPASPEVPPPWQMS